MKRKEIKSIWKLAKIVWTSSTAFWLLETLVFLIVDGWHYKATNPIEIFCDNTVSFLWRMALYLTIYVAYYSLKFLNKKQ